MAQNTIKITSVLLLLGIMLISNVYAITIPADAIGSYPAVVEFSVISSGKIDDSKDSVNNDRERIAREEQEQAEKLLQTTYGDWTCINNRLQRTVTKNNLVQVEYGQICGFELGAKEKSGLQNKVLFAILISLIILIILALILIIRILSR